MTQQPDFKKALEVLKNHNTWRRGCDVTPPTDPKELGVAIDTAIVALLIADKLMQPSQGSRLALVNRVNELCLMEHSDDLHKVTEGIKAFVSVLLKEIV